MNHTGDFQDSRVIALLERLQPVPPRDPEAARRGLELFLAEAGSLGLPEGRSMRARLMGWLKRNDVRKRSLFGWQVSPAMTLAAILVAVVLLFGGSWATAATAQGALPGDALYSVKTGLEDVQVALSRDAANDVELYLKFAQIRLDEIAALIAAGRYDDLPKAVGQFERHIQRAIQALEIVTQGDPARAQGLATSITAALSRYTQILAGLLTSLPQTAHTPIEDAIQFSESSRKISELEFTGTVMTIGSLVWQIDDRSVTVTSETRIEGPVLIGDQVEVKAQVLLDGTLSAKEIKRLDGPDESIEGIEVRFTGMVEAMRASTWTVSGQTIQVNAQTEIEDDITTGDRVEVRALQYPDGSLIATKIELEETEGGEEEPEGEPEQEHEEPEEGEPEEIRFTGTVEAIGAGVWTISGQSLQVNSQTEIEESVTTGDRVEVRALRNPDGSLTATKIELDESEGGDEEPEEDPEEKSDEEPEEIKITGTVQTMGSGVWTIAGQTVQVNGQTEIEEGVTTGDLVEVRAQRNPDGILTATKIELEESEGGEEEPGEDPEEDPEDEPDEIKIIGIVQAMGSSVWTIAGQAVQVNGQTEIEEGVMTGDPVEVRARRNPDGSLLALKIELEDD